jgi:hypothetical protein
MKDPPLPDRYSLLAIRRSLELVGKAKREERKAIVCDLDVETIQREAAGANWRTLHSTRQAAFVHGKV